MDTTWRSNKWLHKYGFKIGYLNVCHIQNKLSDVPSILSNQNDNFHLFGFAESRLSSIVSDNIISVPGYNHVRRDCSKKLETGLVVYVHKSVNYKQLCIANKYNIECIWLQMSFKGSKPLVVGFLYRNPEERNEWFDRFELMMEEVYNYSLDVILLGDFNIDLLKPHNTWKQTYDLCNLSQLITEPTRVSSKHKTLIDHIYMSNPNTAIEISVPCYGLSDHFPVCVVWSKKGVRIPKSSHKIVSFRDYKSFNEQDFLTDLSKADFFSVYQLTDPEEALKRWYDTFLPVFNKHAPLKTKRVRQTPKPPWLTEDIAAEIIKRERLLLTTGKDDNFKRMRNIITNMKRNAKRKYYRELISSKKDTKSVWKAVNQLSGKKSVSPSSVGTGLPAELLNQHFITVAERTIHANNTQSNDLTVLRDFCMSKQITSTLDIPYMSVHEVYKELCSLKQSNCTGLDGLDVKILKASAIIISESLTYIYNLCIAKSQFPQALKDSKVLPVFKSGDASDPSNYRPISLLSILSKPIEKHIQNNVLSHLIEFDLFTPKSKRF